MRFVPLLLLPLFAFGCDDSDEFDNIDNIDDDNEGLNPFGDSFDLTIRAYGWGRWEGRRAVVALYNPGEDDLEARSDDVVWNGRFEFFFSDELEDGEDYQLHYHVDFNGDDDCTPNEVFVRTFVATGDMLIRLPAEDRVRGGSCDLVEFW